MEYRYEIWIIECKEKLRTVSRELPKYKLDLVGVQEVRWEGGGTEPVGEYTYFYRKGMRIMNYVQVPPPPNKRTISAVKRVFIVSDSMSYIILKGH
jgi:hypothetical protein